MKLFGRRPERYIYGLKGLPSFLVAAWRVVCLFKQPWTVIWSYLVRKTPQKVAVLHRSGHIIHLSNDPADIVTVFLIFARRDYGEIVPGSTVIDIGANIGVFALFASISGAKEVYAFEPSGSSCTFLLKNIEFNGLSSIIKAKRLTVVGLPSAPVKFPRNSDVMNAILPSFSASADYDIVPTTTLADIVSTLNSVDILKSDCEGGEYDIFLQATETDVKKIAEIRMEYHLGPRDELISKLKRLSYSVRKFMVDEGGGYLWLKRRSES